MTTHKRTQPDSRLSRQSLSWVCVTRLVLPAASTSIFQKFLTAKIWHLVHQNNSISKIHTKYDPSKKRLSHFRNSDVCIVLKALDRSIIKCFIIFVIWRLRDIISIPVNQLTTTPMSSSFIPHLVRHQSSISPPHTTI